MFEYMENYKVYEIIVGPAGSPDPQKVVVVAESHTDAIDGAIGWFHEGGPISSDTVPHSVKVLEWAPILVK